MYYPRNHFAYWIPTILVALNYTFGGVSSLLHQEASMEIYRKLGYPGYFGVMLGAAQLLAVAAILLPVPSRLREWAYAGLAFDTIAAVVSLLAVGTPVTKTAFPVIALGTIMLCYWAWLARLRGPVSGSNTRQLTAGI